MAIILSILALVALDQGSKLLVLDRLKGQADRIIIEDFFRLRYVENRGAAFGILQGQRSLFFLVSFVVIAILIYLLFLRKDPLPRGMTLALVLVFSGTLGNLIDRIRLHYVVDFLSFKILGHNFAVFNLADSFIVVGTFLLLIFIILWDGKTSE
ncbi:MAG: signal peptidase II [Tissierellia bacterium]|nr:signal peptidase II [Tissierellia bacterium]